MDRFNLFICFSANGFRKRKTNTSLRNSYTFNIQKHAAYLAVVTIFFAGCASSPTGKTLSRNTLKQGSPQAVSSEVFADNQNSANQNIEELEKDSDDFVIQLTGAEESDSVESNESQKIALEIPEIDMGDENSLDHYIRIALSTNPEILAAQHRLAAQSQVIPQVTSLDDPNLVDSFQPFRNNSVQTAAGRGPNTLSLSQKFPWFGKLDTRGRVAEAEVQVAYAQLTQSKLKVIEDVNLAYYEVYYNQKAIKITLEDSRFLKMLVGSENAKFRVGSSKKNLLRTLVELEKLEDQLIFLNRQFRQSQADLAEVIQADPESNLTASSFEVPSAPKQIEQLYEAAISSRPEIQERLHTIIRDQHVEELAHLDYKPDVTFGLGWQAITNDSAISPVTNSNDNVAFTVGINVPIWRDRLRAGVHEAEHRRAASTRRYEAVRDDTFRIIRRLTVQANSLESQIDLYKNKIIRDANEVKNLAFKDYTTGNVDFQQLLDDWSNVLAFRIQLARMESDLGKTLATLERVVGQEMITFNANEPNPALAPVAEPNPAPAQEQAPAQLPAPILPLPAFEE